jgi:hypothetical protein
VADRKADPFALLNFRYAHRLFLFATLVTCFFSLRSSLVFFRYAHSCMHRLAGLVAAVVGILNAQNPSFAGFEPRPKASDYAASKPLVGESRYLAAESLARSVPVSRGGMLFAENHIVIETAFYGTVRSRVSLAAEHFTLVINGKKPEILPDTAGSVAGSMRDSIFSTGPNLQASGSVGDTGVILGRRRPQTGVPDLDTRPGQRPLPPRAPGHEDRSGNAAPQPLDAREEIERVSLSRGEFKLPTGGLLYFPYRGKLKSIKTMILRYHPPQGEVVELNLIPSP